MRIMRYREAREQYIRTTRTLEALPQWNERFRAMNWLMFWIGWPFVFIFAVMLGATLVGSVAPVIGVVGIVVGAFAMLPYLGWVFWVTKQIQGAGRS